MDPRRSVEAGDSDGACRAAIAWAYELLARVSGPTPVDERRRFDEELEL